MTLPTNDDFSTRELSIEELDAVAAGSIWGSIFGFLSDWNPVSLAGRGMGAIAVENYKLVKML
jgi:hypothetical protein